MSTERLLANRNLCNKLWNTCRFIVTGPLSSLNEDDLAALKVTKPVDAAELETLALPERYIISRCHRLAASVTENLDDFVMGAAGSAIARFLWDEFADWYIEISKTRLQGSDVDAAAAADARRTLVYVLDTSLRLLHPFMPYITETLWQRLPHDGDSIMTAQWPQMAGSPALAVDDSAVDLFTVFQVRGPGRMRAQAIGSPQCHGTFAPAGLRSCCAQRPCRVQGGTWQEDCRSHLRG